MVLVMKIYELAKNPYLTIASGLGSIVSCIVGFFATETQLLWGIFTLCLLIFLIVLILTSQNNRLIGKMDKVDYHIFNQNIVLEHDLTTNKYVSKDELTLVLHMLLTNETSTKQHKAFIEIRFPSVIEIDHHWTSEKITQLDDNSDFTSFSILLSSGVTLLALKSITLDKNKEDEFYRTGKKIEVTIKDELTNEEKKASIPILVS